MNTFKLSTWKKHSFERVYITGLIGQGHGDKIWVERQKSDFTGCDWAIKVKLVASSPMARGLEDRAAEIFGKTAVDCASISFDQICERGAQ